MPELRKKQVEVYELSKEIQLVNDTGAAHLNAIFVSNGDGTFRLKIANEAQKNDFGGFTVGNTGSVYSGDWRATASYVSNDISGRADTLGVAYVTSPDQHLSDVKQTALSYRRLLPELGGTLLVSYSYSDVDLGNIAPRSWDGLLDYNAAGRGTNFGVHYQQNLAYHAREKDLLDFGVDYRRSRSDYRIGLAGAGTLPYTTDYHVTLAGLKYLHQDRGAHHALSYELGGAANVNGDPSAYEAATPGSARDFAYLTAGASYETRLAGDWLLSTRVHGQYTGAHLPTLAQLGAGGLYSVRGFDTNVISADKGVVGSLELYTPEIAPGSRFLAFLDAANLANNLGADTTCFGSEHIASAGLGYRFTSSDRRLSLAVDYTKIIDNLPDGWADGQKSRRWNTVVSFIF